MGGEERDGKERFCGEYEGEETMISAEMYMERRTGEKGIVP